MIANILQQIKDRTIEAIDLAKKMQEATSEGFIIHTTIPNSLTHATITIQGFKRPFPIGKFPLIQHAIHGAWWYKKTSEDFVKINSARHNGDSRVKLNITLLMGECLNPLAHGTIKVHKGTRGRVLDPAGCNGLEHPLMLGLGLQTRINSEINATDSKEVSS
jgi:hypothetical protein